MQSCAAVRLNNSDLRQRVTEVGVACPRSLARVDDLAAGIAGVIDAAVLADSVPAGVIAETDHFRVAGSIGAGHLRQLAAMLPSIGPCPVIGQVTDGIGGQCLSIIAGEQILPRAVAIAVGDGIQCRAQRARGVGILRLAEDVAAVVVGVDPRLARRLIVLAGQLVEAVVDVAGGVGAVGYRCNIAPCIVGVGVGRAADCPLVDLRTGGGRSGILVGDAGADNGAAAVLGGNAGHAAVDIVGVVGTLAACCRLLQPVVVVVGVVGSIAGIIQCLGLRGQVVLVVIAPLHGVAVVASCLLVAHQTILEIVGVLGLAPGDVVGQDAQIAVVVVGVLDSFGVVLVADGGRAPVAVIAVGDVVTIAVVGACQPMTGVVGIGVADQRAAADLDAVHKVKCAVGERIVRAGSAGDSGQQVAVVGVVHRGAALGHAGGAVTAVVAVIGAGSSRFAGCLRPIQNAGLRVIAIGSGLTQCIRDRGKLVPVRGVRRRGSDLLRTAANGDLGVVAVAVIGEVGYHALGTGGGQHIVVAVVGVLLAGTGRQRHFGQIVAAVFVGGGLFLQVGDAGYIAVAVIDVAVAELLLKQLDPIKVYLIYVVAVK